MYYGRKKGIIIAIVAIVVILVAILGVLVVTQTDLFKSNENLFWKYMGNGLGSIEIPTNIQMEEIQKKKAQSPYTTNGDLTLSTTEDDINNTLKNLKLSFEGQTDKSNDYSYIETKLNYNNATMFELKYAHNDDIYALKSDEIATAFIGIRNKNLNVLMQKLGINTIFNIPNEISLINYTSLSKITDEEKAHINETYSNVITQNITKDSYSKQTEAVIEKDRISYTTTSYRLDLSAELISNIVLNTLNTLKTDSITLNIIATKAKELGLDENYTTIDGINELIDEMIEEVGNVTFVDTSFVVYAYKGETIATEILFKNTAKVTVYIDSSIKIKYENLELNSEFTVMNIEITNKNTSTQSVLSVKANIDDEFEVVLDITNTGSATQGILDTDIIASITNADETYEITYVKTIEFINELENIQRIDETNCAILNDYSQQDLNTLMQALANQIKLVYNQKAQMLGLSDYLDIENEIVPDDTVQQ